jgi:hypothetical protein
MGKLHAQRLQMGEKKNEPYQSSNCERTNYSSDLFFSTTIALHLVQSEGTKVFPLFSGHESPNYHI